MTTPSNLEPPTLSEVIRNIQELKGAVQGFALNFVTIPAYVADKEGITLKFEQSNEVHKDLANDIAKLQTAVEKNQKTTDDRFTEIMRQNTEKLLWSNRLMLGAFATGISSLIITLLTKGS